MKNFIYLTLLLSVCFVACNRDYTHNSSIIKADKLMETSPVDGIKLLQQFKHPEDLSKSDYASWCMVYNYGLYKMDSVITSDSLINIAITYFSGTQNYFYSGKCYYILGYYYEMNNRNEEAMESYKHAENLLLKVNAYNLLGLVYFRIGYLYSLDELYDKSILNFKKSRENFHLAGNIKNEAYSYRDLASSYDNLDKSIDSVMNYYEKAEELSFLTRDTANYYDISYKMAITLLNKTTDYERAKQLLLAAYRYDNNSKFYYNKLSLIYSKLNMQDSAMFFFKKALPDTFTVANKAAAYLSGAMAEQAAGNYKKALNYYILYDRFREKVITETKRYKLYRIDKRYSLVMKENENSKLKIANRNMVIFMAVLVVLVLLALIFMLTMSVKQKKEQVRHELDKQKLLSEIENKRILLLTKIQYKIDTSLRFHKLKGKYPIGSINYESFVDEMMKQTILNEDEWQSYIDEVNQIFNNYINQLSSNFQTITLSDKIVIALIALQMDITDTCIVLGLSKNTMYRRRNTIKERLGLDKSVDLEKWIHDQIAMILNEEKQLNLMNKIFKEEKSGILFCP